LIKKDCLNTENMSSGAVSACRLFLPTHAFDDAAPMIIYPAESNWQ